MIRPTKEVMQKLVNPEKNVTTIDDHITRLKMALLENYENRHTQNRVYHMLYDAYYLA
jgi:hypothetical protein